MENVAEANEFVFHLCVFIREILGGNISVRLLIWSQLFLFTFFIVASYFYTFFMVLSLFPRVCAFNFSISSLND